MVFVKLRVLGDSGGKGEHNCQMSLAFWPFCRMSLAFLSNVPSVLAVFEEEEREKEGGGRA